jgi:Helix-turn-helix domain
MGLRRRVEITIQRRELILSVGGKPPQPELCPSCHCEVNMLPVEAAAKAFGISPRTLYRWIEQDRVHYRELNDGTILVCEKSLAGE